MPTKTAKEKKSGQLGDWLEDVPEPVQIAADAYDKAHSAKTKADGKCNVAKENVIEVMREHDCTTCRIRNGEKVLELSSTDSVKIKKPEDRTDAQSNDDDAESNGDGNTAFETDGDD